MTLEMIVISGFFVIALLLLFAWREIVETKRGVALLKFAESMEQKSLRFTRSINQLRKEVREVRTQRQEIYNIENKENNKRRR